MKHHDQLATMTIDVTAAEIKMIEECINWMAVEGCEDVTGQFTVDIRPYCEIHDLLRPGVSKLPHKFAAYFPELAKRFMDDAKFMIDEGFPFEECERRVMLAEKLEKAATCSN